MSGPITLSEAAISEQLGVSREVLARVRESALVEGEDWMRGARGAFLYADSGVEKLRAALLSRPIEKNAAQEAPDAAAEASALIVTRPARVNRRLIFAREKKAGDAGAEMPVRVQDARNFTKGQEILATCEGGFWRLFGRQPRGRGKLKLPPRGKR